MLMDTHKPTMRGHIRIYEQDNPENVVFDQENVIVNAVTGLFARLMANSAEPMAGVWGLAVGAGDSSWAEDSQDPAVATQTALFNQILRKKCSFIRFVDENLNPVPGQTDYVDFQTILNVSLDGINVPIREIGLIGGGTHGTPDTVMSTAPFWDPATRDPNSVTLINYKTMLPLVLPSGINFVCSWVLRFA